MVCRNAPQKTCYCLCLQTCSSVLLMVCICHGPTKCAHVYSWCNESVCKAQKIVCTMTPASLDTCLPHLFWPGANAVWSQTTAYRCEQSRSNSWLWKFSTYYRPPQLLGNVTLLRLLVKAAWLALQYMCLATWEVWIALFSLFCRKPVGLC